MSPTSKAVAGVLLCEIAIKKDRLGALWSSILEVIIRVYRRRGASYIAYQTKNEKLLEFCGSQGHPDQRPAIMLSSVFVLIMGYDDMTCELMFAHHVMCMIRRASLFRRM